MSAAAPADPAVGLGQIQAADPAFDIELFKRRAVQTFLAVKQAIQARDLSDIVDQLSDRVFDDLLLEVQSLEARDAVEHFDGLAPRQVLVAGADRSSAGDAITLRIQAVATEYLGPAGGAGLAPGSPGAFTEFWTFTRPFDAASPSAHRNECPTCGAPIDIDTGRICHYCKTLLPPRQAQVGWVVAAIQSARENAG